MTQPLLVGGSDTAHQLRGAEGASTGTHACWIVGQTQSLCFPLNEDRFSAIEQVSSICGRKTVAPSNLVGIDVDTQWKGEECEERTDGTCTYYRMCVTRDSRQTDSCFIPTLHCIMLLYSLSGWGSSQVMSHLNSTSPWQCETQRQEKA